MIQQQKGSYSGLVTIQQLFTHGIGFDGSISKDTYHVKDLTSNVQTFKLKDRPCASPKSLASSGLVDAAINARMSSGRVSRLRSTKPVIVYDTLAATTTSLKVADMLKAIIITRIMSDVELISCGWRDGERWKLTAAGLDLKK